MFWISILRFLGICPYALADSCNIKTSFGAVQGYDTGSACRFSVQYAQAERWGYSTVRSSVPELTTVNQIPPSCPQPEGNGVSSDTQNEDCLYAVAYYPKSAGLFSSLPVFVWIHGGSFNAGSASAPGLDGSALANKGNMVVIVLQYRLGVFGMLPPSQASTASDPNLGLLDVINGLKAVHQYINRIGGDASRVTVGGQSSGASMIRALWGAPSAKGLFRAAIMQSDPMNYGFASSTLTSQLRDGFYASSPMSSCSDLACLRNIPTADIISAQSDFTPQAPFIYDGDVFAEPLRPTFGVASLPQDPTAQLWNSPGSLATGPSTLPLLISTVKNEAGSATDSLFPSPQPISSSVLVENFAALAGQAAALAVTSSSYYTLSANETTGDVFRQTFERVATDGTWRCPNRQAAQRWAQADGKVWVAEWDVGWSYPDNQAGYCQTPGVVCHEDDIYPTFGTSPTGNSTIAALQKKAMKHWITFIHHAEIRSRTWRPVGRTDGTDSAVYALGGGEVLPCAGGDDFWGKDAQYAWQMYG